MKRIQKLAIVLAAMSLAFAPSIFAGGSGEKSKDSGKDSKPITMTFAHHLPPATIHHKAMALFAESVQKRSGGKIQITVSHSGQLGGQRELIEAVKMGTIEIGFGESGRYEAYVPELGVNCLPFIYKDANDYYQTVDGAIGTEMAKLLREKANLEVLCWTGGTQRNVFIKKEPTAKLSTMSGIKIRTPESAIYVNTFKALGANPTPIAATEMYSAIQSGVVDAMEGSFDTVYTYKIYEVAKFCLETGHITEDNSYVMNAKAFQKMPADLQKALLDGAKEAAEYQRREAGVTNDSVKKKLAAEGGMKFTVANHDELVQAVAPVYKTFADKSPQCAAIIKKMGKY